MQKNCPAIFILFTILAIIFIDFCTTLLQPCYLVQRNRIAHTGLTFTVRQITVVADTVLGVLYDDTHLGSFLHQVTCQSQRYIVCILVLVQLGFPNPTYRTRIRTSVSTHYIEAGSLQTVACHLYIRQSLPEKRLVNHTFPATRFPVPAILSSSATFCMQRRQLIFHAQTQLFLTTQSLFIKFKKFLIITSSRSAVALKKCRNTFTSFRSVALLLRRNRKRKYNQKKGYEQNTNHKSTINILERLCTNKLSFNLHCGQNYIIFLTFASSYMLIDKKLKKIDSIMAKQFKPETLCVQAGWSPKKGEPRVLPIYQSTTFKYETSEQMARLFDLEESGYFYTRLQNPTNDAVAAKIAALEGGVAAMLTSSGQAANYYAIFNICEAGDHFVCSSAIYGGTFNLFGVTMKKQGIDVTFVNPDASEEEISAAFRPNTKALFGETISNPALEVLDIEKFARIAHKHGVPLIVDNTFPTPINCRPFEWGADIVVHSTTKYMDGHATSVGGCIVDSGNFDWDAHADKFPGLCTPDESYHGLTYTKAFGKMAYITKATAQLMRDLGSIQSPENAFLLNLGLETLHLRMPQHCKNAQAVAEYLQKNEKVAWVNYCGLPDNKYYELAQKYMPNGSCGVISFGLKGGRDVAIRFMDNLKLAAIVTHVADARTCVLHPASHTHRQLTDEQLIEAGVRPDLIRFSVGIENVDDIIADIEQALNA